MKQSEIEPKTGIGWATAFVIVSFFPSCFMALPSLITGGPGPEVCHGYGVVKVINIWLAFILPVIFVLLTWLFYLVGYKRESRFFARLCYVPFALLFLFFLRIFVGVEKPIADFLTSICESQRRVQIAPPIER